MKCIHAENEVIIFQVFTVKRTLYFIPTMCAWTRTEFTRLSVINNTKDKTPQKARNATRLFGLAMQGLEYGEVEGRGLGFNGA